MSETKMSYAAALLSSNDTIALQKRIIELEAENKELKLQKQAIELEAKNKELKSRINKFDMLKTTDYFKTMRIEVANAMVDYSYRRMQKDVLNRILQKYGSDFALCEEIYKVYLYIIHPGSYWEFQNHVDKYYCSISVRTHEYFIKLGKLLHIDIAYLVGNNERLK
jgi:hypothetical protein